MEHSIVTPEPSDQMPRQQGLLPHGNRWYSNFKVPLDLQAALGKTHIREALGTSDYREACSKIAYERARATALFEKTRTGIAQTKAPPSKRDRRTLTVVTDREAYQFCIRYLASREHAFKKWMNDEGRHLEPHRREEMAASVRWDAFDLQTGEEFRGKTLDGTGGLQAFADAAVFVRDGEEADGDEDGLPDWQEILTATSTSTADYNSDTGFLTVGTPIMTARAMGRRWR